MLDAIVSVLPMLVCLFWSVVLFFEVISRRRDHARIWLLLFMCTATLLYLGHAAYFNHCKTGIEIYDTMYVTCNLAVYPLYYEYVRALTATSRSFPQRHHLWLLPALLGGITVGVLYLLMDNSQIQMFVDYYLYDNHMVWNSGLVTCQSVVHHMLKIWFALQIILLLGIELRMIRRYNQQLDLFYSDSEQRSLASVAVMLKLLLLVSIISFAFNMIGRSYFSESTWTLMVPSLLFSALLFALGYLGSHRPFTIDEILSAKVSEENDVTEDTAHIEEATTEQNKKNTVKFEELASRITSLMKDDKVYLRPDLNLIDLAQMLNTNQKYVYIAFSTVLNIKFSEYVNRHRVEHASRILQENPGLKLEEVALKSGYTSPATFYRNFKQLLGCTPKEFLEKSKGQVT